MNIKKVIYFSCILSIIVLSVYWSKNQFGINFLDSFSLSQYYPFKLFQRNAIIPNSRNGELFFETFEFPYMNKNWLGILAPNKKRVHICYQTQDDTKSRCLCITNTSFNGWSLSHNKFIKMESCDSIYYELDVHLTGDSLKAYIGIDIFDEYLNPRIWFFDVETVDNRHKWIHIRRGLKITSDNIYLRFRLAGEDQGIFRFDNIRFVKIK